MREHRDYVRSHGETDMVMPADVGVIDLMIAPPFRSSKRTYEFLRANLRDRESLEDFEFPAQYMFKDVPHPEPGGDPVAFLLDQMDRFGIEKGMVGVSFDNERTADALRAVREHPDRFFGSYEVNPNRGMDAVRDLQRAVEELGVKGATAFPAGMLPQVPINDAKFYPLYAKCIELDIPICVCAGVPGPRVPFAPQYVGLIDEVCWYFPELKFVTRHGCEPWTALAAKLMLKWPNLYYSTSAFAPKHYPKDIVHYANTRGADKIMYSGYFPMGLSLDRIFSELPGVPFRDHVWPKFLRDNALRLFGMEKMP
ncbi:MAG TPA: amidohydrolase family protein [Candidatus Cybelea sp.]|nr:amidohydrolase family protein [Candidatus Cybelea sp.]